MIGPFRLHPDAFRAWQKLEPEIAALGLTYQVRSTTRTCAQQQEQWEIGRLPGDTRAKVTNAKGCQSWHVHGRAIDLTLYRNGKPALIGDYKALADIAELQDWKWGGAWKDDGHFEYHPGLTIAMVCPNPDDCRDCVDCVESLPEPASSSGLSWGRIFLLVAGAVGLAYASKKLAENYNSR